MNERPTFNNEKDALDKARAIASLIVKNGAQPDLPKEKLAMADAYAKLAERLTPYGRKPEEAVDHFLKSLGDEILRQAKPPIRNLVDQWQAHKLLDSTLDDAYRNEIKTHCRYIKRTWGDKKPDEVRKNDIDATLKKRPGTNNTRKKYLTFIRMFFNWVLGEDKHYILTNPANGIRFKPDGFEKDFYPPATIKTLMRYVVQNHKELTGYYALLTFAGLRPSEGARVQWNHINFETNQLKVLKGKSDTRHILLEPVAIEWMKFHKENSAKDAPFVPQQNLFNLERKVRESMKGKWIADGLRHGFATFYTSLKQEFPTVAWYMGNSVAMIKKHYAQTIPSEQLNQFWALTPAVVLAEEQPNPQTNVSQFGDASNLQSSPPNNPAP